MKQPQVDASAPLHLAAAGVCALWAAGVSGVAGAVAWLPATAARLEPERLAT